MVSSEAENFAGVNKFLTPLTILLLFFFTLAGIIVSCFFETIKIEHPGLINTVSVFGFFILCIYGLTSYARFFLLLPFVLLAYPSAVNDFFPSVYLGQPYELGAALFPFITHIDIFLGLGLLKRIIDQRGSFKTHVNWLTGLIIILFLTSTFINLILVKDAHHFALLIAGLFPLRYLVLLILLVSNHEVEKYERQIVTGIILSIFFLFLESTVNSYINKTDVLSSGTLASNTFANITAAILIFVIYLKRQSYSINFFVLLAFLATGILIILLTETRMAILAALVSFFLIQMRFFKWYKTLFVVFTLGVLVLMIYNSIEVPDRYSVSFLLSKIQYQGFSTNIFEMITIERSLETSSIYSRLKLYQTSINMFADSPMWGVGYGAFNYLKNDFGFDEFVLIDAHNGYLNALAQMGISSIFLLYFIYLYPFFNYRKIKGSTFLKYLFVINFTMAIADLSNAGIYKTSVFALLAFNTLVIMNFKKRS